MLSSVLGASDFTALSWLVVVFYGVLRVNPYLDLSDISLWCPDCVYSSTGARWYFRVPNSPNHLVCA